MTEEARRWIRIAAPPEHCYEVAADFARYPEWAGDIKRVEVLERDHEGRGVRVRFRAAAMGQSVGYTLVYDHREAPRVLSWVQVAGDMTRQLDGSYTFEPAPDGGTDLTYQLTVELKVPLIRFIKRRAEARILGTALRDLKSRAES